MRDEGSAPEIAVATGKRGQRAQGIYFASWRLNHWKTPSDGVFQSNGLAAD